MGACSKYEDSARHCTFYNNIDKKRRLSLRAAFLHLLLARFASSKSIANSYVTSRLHIPNPGSTPKVLFTRSRRGTKSRTANVTTGNMSHSPHHPETPAGYPTGPLVFCEASRRACMCMQNSYASGAQHPVRFLFTFPGVVKVAKGAKISRLRASLLAHRNFAAF